VALPGPVTVTVPCSTSPDADAPTVEHAATLHPDGRLDTPHDLPAERIALAFGGFLTCVRVVDRLVPALPAWWEVQTRAAPPAIRRKPAGTWHPSAAQASPCCRSSATAAQMATHLRTSAHLATRLGLPSRVVEPFTAALLEHGPGEALPGALVVEARHCVRCERDLAELWRAGLHPARVRAVHARVVGEGGPPLPPAVYLGAVTRRPDLAWVVQTLAAVDAAAPEPLTDDEAADLAEWLTWTQTGLDRRHRSLHAEWLVLGVPRAWVAEIGGSGYTPADVALLGSATGRGVVGAVRMLRGWAATGCHPAVDDLVALHAEGVPAWYQPSAGAVRRLAERLADVPHPPDDTALGLALARHGTVVAAERAVRDSLQPRRACA
jgi:hypothetical protein